MKKLALLLCCFWALNACDSSSSSLVNSASDAEQTTEAESEEGGDGAGSDNGPAVDTGTDNGGDAGTDNQPDTDSGSSTDGQDGSDTATDTDTDTDTETETETEEGEGGEPIVPQPETDTEQGEATPSAPVSCTPPALGTVFAGLGSTALTDGCSDGEALDLAAITAASGYQELFNGGPNVDAGITAGQVKGLYLYTQGGAPGYVVLYHQVGPSLRAGELAYVTSGPGVYYLPLSRSGDGTGVSLSGLGVAAWSSVPGQAVSISEVTWASVDEDVSAVPKLHWRAIESAVAGSVYPLASRYTLASSGHNLRELSHRLSSEITQQYIDLLAGDCARQPLGFNDISSIRLVDATGELGRAWVGRDLIVRSSDDPSRPIYAVSVDWDYATQSSAEEIVASLDGKAYLWPNADRPDTDLSRCHGRISLEADYDQLRVNPPSAGLWLH